MWLGGPSLGCRTWHPVGSRRRLDGGNEASTGMSGRRNWVSQPDVSTPTGRKGLPVDVRRNYCRSAPKAPTMECVSPKLDMKLPTTESGVLLGLLAADLSSNILASHMPESDALASPMDQTVPSLASPNSALVTRAAGFCNSMFQPGSALPSFSRKLSMLPERCAPLVPSKSASNSASAVKWPALSLAGLSGLLIANLPAALPV